MELSLARSHALLLLNYVAGGQALAPGEVFFVSHNCIQSANFRIARYPLPRIEDSVEASRSATFALVGSCQNRRTMITLFLIRKGFQAMVDQLGVFGGKEQVHRQACVARLVFRKPMRIWNSFVTAVSIDPNSSRNRENPRLERPGSVELFVGRQDARPRLLY